MAIFSRTIVVAALLSATGGVAADSTTSAAPSSTTETRTLEWVVEPYPGSVLRSERVEAFGEYHRIVGFADRANQVETLMGQVARRVFDQPAGRSTLEMLENYREALLVKGFSVDYECAGRNACGSIANPSWNAINGINTGVVADVRYLTAHHRSGDDLTHVSVAMTPTRTWIDIVSSASMQTGQVRFGVREMVEGLESEGRVAIEHLYFDTAKSTLRVESEPALQDLAQLLRERTDWAVVWIVGHTDSQGDIRLNERLARDRAAAVREALVQRFGIDAERIQTFGVGPFAPRDSNQTDGGRANNRRVELVLP